MGGTIVEAYPVDQNGKEIPDAFAFHGLASTFEKAGFNEADRRSPTRPIMRLELKRKKKRRCAS